MSADGELVPLRRPPIRQSTTVRSDLEHVFHGFVRTIAAWWPLRPMSLGGERVRDVTFEERAGGRVYETWDDGTTVEWGQLTVWSPPDRFLMSWNTTPEPTVVRDNTSTDRDRPEPKTKGQAAAAREDRERKAAAEKKAGN